MKANLERGAIALIQHGHHGVAGYGWSFFRAALDELVAESKRVNTDNYGESS